MTTTFKQGDLVATKMDLISVHSNELFNKYGPYTFLHRRCTYSSASDVESIASGAIGVVTMIAGYDNDLIGVLTSTGLHAGWDYMFNAI